MLGEGGDEADEEAVEETNESSTKDNSEEGECCHEDLSRSNRGHVQQSDHGVVQNHRHSIIEKRLSKHKKIQTNIHVNLLESKTINYYM